jgi:hypothetical protein
MSTRRFFQLSLLLPIAVGAIGLVVPGFGLPAATLIYGGIPYLLVAAAAYFAIGGARTLARLASISIAMPLALLLLLAPLDPIIGTMGLFVGVCYVAIAWALYVAARKFGLVAAMPPNNSLERSRGR